jgi:Gas vesicle protein K
MTRSQDDRGEHGDGRHDDRHDDRPRARPDQRRAGAGKTGAENREPTIAERVLAGHDWTADLSRSLERLQRGPRQRLDADEHDVEKGLARLVLTLVELLRQVMERQAIRRVEGGTLPDEQVERLGRALMLLEQRMGELREAFDLAEEDLNLDLGPLGRLL